MDALRIILTTATLLCSLVAGFLIAFTLVVMPGIKSLNDHDYLQGFKVMDKVIQNNQPLFILIWLGSILAIIAAVSLGIIQLNGTNRILIIAASAIYLFGVQLPTVSIHIPLNNQLQTQDLDRMSESELHEVRTAFEPQWIRWNTIRTIFAVFSALVLIILILRL